MELPVQSSENATMSEILELATWNRPRSDEELRSFVETHHAALPELAIE